MAAENTGPERDPQGGRSHLLEITGLIAGEQLRMNWTFSENIHRRETIEELAQVFLSELQALIVHCQSSEAGGYTPSDFADFGWSQSELNSITTIISESAEQG
jgi:non-ribosomal peptide synthase protein (TIGR01720 family)